MTTAATMLSDAADSRGKTVIFNGAVNPRRAFENRMRHSTNTLSIMKDMRQIVQEKWYIIFMYSFIFFCMSIYIF